MIKPHFTWIISANKKMQLQSSLLIESIKMIDCHCTIWVQNSEQKDISVELKKKAEIKTYMPDERFTTPWRIHPKWEIEPNGDVIVGLDSDIIIWDLNRLQLHLNECFADQKILGTIAYVDPLKERWNDLCLKHNVQLNLEYSYLQDKTPAPYYINNGVIMLPTIYLKNFAKVFKKWLIKVNDFDKNLFFLSQIAICLTIHELQLPHKAMPKTFNYLESHNQNFKYLNEATFLHYNKTKDIIYNKRDISLIENKQFREMLSKITDINV